MGAAIVGQKVSALSAALLEHGGYVIVSCDWMVAAANDDAGEVITEADLWRSCYRAVCTTKQFYQASLANFLDTEVYIYKSSHSKPYYVTLRL